MCITKVNITITGCTRMVRYSYKKLHFIHVYVCTWVYVCTCVYVHVRVCYMCRYSSESVCAIFCVHVCIDVQHENISLILPTWNYIFASVPLLDVKKIHSTTVIKNLRFVFTRARCAATERRFWGFFDNFSVRMWLARWISITNTKRWFLQIAR